MAMDEKQRARMELIAKVVNASPFYRHLGMAIVGYDEGTSVLTMPFDSFLTNLYGIAHGGAIASIADSACGLALASKLDEGQTAVTVDLRVNYISPFSGGTLVARGEVIHKSGSTSIELARLTQDESRLVGIAMAVHYIKQA
jgi:uncharacterized protein (TIGR00369 family)